MNQKIELSFIRPHINSFMAERDFPKLCSSWLPPVCLKFLNKLIERFFYTESTIKEVYYSRHVIDQEKVMDAILGQDRMIQMICGRKARGILIGPRQMGLLEKDAQPYAFDVGIELMSYKKGREVFNLSVEIVPWLDGVILLPAKQ